MYYAQHEIEIKRVFKSKINLYKYVDMTMNATKTDYLRPALAAIFYNDKREEAVASDGCVLVCSKKLYDPNLAGIKVTKEGNLIEEEYPNYQSVIERNKRLADNSQKIDTFRLLGFIKGLVEKIRWNGIDVEAELSTKRNELEEQNIPETVILSALASKEKELKKRFLSTKKAETGILVLEFQSGIKKAFVLGQLQKVLECMIYFGIDEVYYEKENIGTLQCHTNDTTLLLTPCYDDAFDDAISSYKV